MRHPLPNLYICRSPLQLLNCIEACEKLGQNGGANILICAWRAEIDRRMMQHALELYPHWSEIHFFSLYPTKNQIPILLDVFRKRRHFANLFIGDTTHLINIFINKVGNFESIYLVDDGTATISLAKRIATHSIHRIRKNNTPRGRLSTVLQARLGLSPMFMYQAKFFTFYQIGHLGLADRIVPNDFKFIKSRIQDKPRSEEIWFIGSNIREIILKNNLDYDDFLAQVNQRVDLSKVVYIPHRKEHDSYLSDISKRFKMEIRRMDSILEIELTRTANLPRSIISFGSSALDTLDILAKSPVTVFCIPEKSIKTTSKSAYRDMYDSMKDKGFKMIELNDPTPI
ncbi:hypothetical protein [Aquabacterium sp.]|uniref:hypothetical protein n=1 Tax=Aquabacterium sp. TaxID=1872578 RepID=UPI003D06A98F